MASTSMFAQPLGKRAITLVEAITLARVQSVDAAVALNELKRAYWEFRTYKADLLPEMNLNATLPNYKNRYSLYPQDDGSYLFNKENNLQIDGELSIDQNIWLTGGSLSLNTSLEYLKQLDGNKRSNYMSIPVALTLNQPIFGVNKIARQVSTKNATPASKTFFRPKRSDNGPRMQATNAPPSK